MTKFWYDENGGILRATSDDVKSVEGANGFTTTAPVSGKQTWSGTRWNDLSEPSYREKRKAAYIAELGQSSDVVDTLGDVVDDLMREVRALSNDTPKTAEFKAVIDTVDAIKARFPKSQ